MKFDEFIKSVDEKEPPSDLSETLTSLWLSPQASA